MSEAPRYLIDVVVPIHAIGPVFVDTLLSVFNQQRRLTIHRCTVVVDGCPHVGTTAGHLEDLLASQLFDLDVIYQKNRGVTASRNRVIRRILDKPVRPDFVLFLDGDDLLACNYIDASVEALLEARRSVRDNGKPAWAYADQFHFGDSSRWVQYPTKLWGARFALNNYSQTSSVVDIRVLEDGVLFDEDFKLGIEDWEFWRTAIDQGFIGVHVNKTFAFYRRLMGSRSSSNRSNDGLTKFRMRKKHPLELTKALTEGEALFPRIGILVQTDDDEQCANALAIPAQARINGNDLLALQRALARIAPRARYRTRTTGAGAYLDEPYLPDLIIIAARSVAGSKGIASIIYAVENIFENDHEVALVMAEDSSGRAFLIASLSRLYGVDGFRRRPLPLKIVRLDHYNVNEAFRGKLPSAEAALGGEFFVAAQLLDAAAPDRCRTIEVHFPRFIVGTPVAGHFKFFRLAFGFVPIHSPLIRHRLEGKDVVGFVVNASGHSFDPHSIAIRANAIVRVGGAACLFLAGPGPENLIVKRLIEEIAWTDLFSLYDVVARVHSPNRRYNGAAPDARGEAWYRYAAGCLSMCNRIENHGVSDLTPALAMLRPVVDADMVYFPAGGERTISEVEHLCAFSGIYRQVKAASNEWSILARAMGVRHVSDT